MYPKHVDVEDGIRQNVEGQDALHHNENFPMKKEEVTDYEFDSGADL